jgi:alanine racemase
MRKLLLTTAFACVFIWCMAVKAGIDCKWVTTLKPGDGSSFEVTYTFKTEGKKFTGDVLFPGNNHFAITDGTIKGDSIQFFVMLNGKGVPNYGRVYADSIALDIAMNNVKHHHTLKRLSK